MQCMQSFWQGSSPHARGTRSDGHMSLKYVGDHPRMRGEHLRRQRRYELRLGSSPHARGTRILQLHHGQIRGIIPACAGNTAKAPPYGCRVRDHPRMRGEHSQDPSLWLQGKGSSPHARGTHHQLLHWVAGFGIIPACAGNTAPCIPVPISRWDHPRMRGEHLFLRIDVTDTMGSSPHARGTRVRINFRILIIGIIPACAGNTIRGLP